MKQYHFLYKTTNTINHKIYVGVHSTDDINDGYLGSGSGILAAIKKYGRSAFTREILEWFDWRCEALNRESQIVNAEFIKRRDTYNKFIGGETGAYGFTHTIESRRKMSESHIGILIGRTQSDETRARMSSAAYARYSDKTNHPFYGKTREFSDSWLDNIRKASELRRGKYTGENSAWFGRKHTESSRSKIKAARSKQVISQETINKFKTSRIGVVVEQSTRDKISAIQSMRCVIDGVEYDSLIKASKSLGISDTTVGRRLKSDKFPTWNYIQNTKD